MTRIRSLASKAVVWAFPAHGTRLRLLELQVELEHQTRQLAEIYWVVGGPKVS